MGSVLLKRQMSQPGENTPTMVLAVIDIEQILCLSDKS